MMTSVPLPEVWPSADGTGVGAAVGGAIDAVADDVAAAVALGAAVAIGVGEGVGAAATVNVHVPRASSSSWAEMVVHSTRYEPGPSGVSGVATIRLLSSGSRPPWATVPPPTSFTTRLLPSTLTRWVKLPDTSVPGAV